MEGDAVVVMNAIRRVVKALRQAEVSSSEGLAVGAAQLFVLREVSKAGVLTIGELARRTATTQSSVSEVVSRLAQRGLVSRGTSAADRRRAEISLTPAGESLLARSPETLQERMLAGLRRMPPAHQAALAATLSEWVTNAGLGTVEATMFFEPPARGEGRDEG